MEFLYYQKNVIMEIQKNRRSDFVQITIIYIDESKFRVVPFQSEEHLHFKRYLENVCILHLYIIYFTTWHQSCHKKKKLIFLNHYSTFTEKPFSLFDTTFNS